MNRSVKDLKRGQFSLLAPAGSFESLHAAIRAGADAVYFGAGRLNMRSRSSGNFTLKDLGPIAGICRKNNVKSCLTLNTLIYDRDIPLMRETVAEAGKQGVSALIVTDIAAVEHAGKTGMEIHLSTQLNIGNSEAVRFFSRYADVMVLARELSLDQVRHISGIIDRDNITGPSGEKVRLEVFIHGALCMAVSGKCYLSLHEQNSSANRGACLQVCRRAYIASDKESGRELEIDNEYIMSPKDLCTIHFLNKIVDSGATVFKIEGRARSPEYVQTVTECYAEALEAIADGSYSAPGVKEWRERLASVFNRGFWDGYYLGQKLGEWSNVYGSVATRKKIYSGRAVNYYKKIGVAEFIIENGILKRGDEVLIIGPKTGVIRISPDEIRNDEGQTDMVQKGETCAFKVPAGVRRSDKLYRLENRQPQ